MYAFQSCIELCIHFFDFIYKKGDSIIGRVRKFNKDFRKRNIKKA